MTASAVTTQDGVTYDNDLTSFEATSDNVKLIGRYYRNEAADDTIFGYTDSGVEFKTSGSTFVRFHLRRAGDATRIAVYVNGELYKVGTTQVASTKTVAIDVALDGGENTVKLIKIAECPQTVMAIDEILTDGTISPTEAKAHRIEFIGDSITCGYGADAPLGKAFKTNNENGAKTYAYLTAGNLDADYSMVSLSGWGVISGYTSLAGEKSEGQLVPAVYDKLCSTWNTIDKLDLSSIEWDFSQFQPEVVVVNLGTNDNSYCGGDEARCQEYVEGYKAFLADIRAKNPDAKIVCSLGIMGDELWDYLTQAAEQYIEESGDNNVVCFHFNNQNSDENGYAVDYHPSEASHRDASEELTQMLSVTMDWDTVEFPETGMAGYSMDDDVKFAECPGELAAEESSVVEEESSVVEESSAVEESSSSAAESSSSQAASSSSKAASASTTNPSTGTAAGLALIAAMGGAVIVAKKRK